MKHKHKGLSFYQKKRGIKIEHVKEAAGWIFSGLVMVLIAFVCVYLFGLRTSVIGISMEPTLYNGQEILIDRFAYNIGSPKQGDVVIFKPNGNANAHLYVKRIVGVPGDTVLIRDGLIFVNGDIYDDMGIFDKIEEGGIAEAGISLEEDEYFVLGDNRNNSEDSRSSNIGVVKREYMTGKAWFQLGIRDRQPGFIK